MILLHIGKRVFLAKLQNLLIDINGNLEVSGTLTQTGVATFTATPVFSSDVTITDDLNLVSDGAVITFGANNDVTITHDPEDGLFFKSIATGASNPFLLTIQYGETNIAADDVIGKIQFQTPEAGDQQLPKIPAKCIRVVHPTQPPVGSQCFVPKDAI